MGVYCGSGCLGCSFCDEEPLSTFELEKTEQKRVDSLRAKNWPTLSVKFEEHLSKNEHSL